MNNTMETLLDAWDAIRSRLHGSNEYLGLLGIRLILGYEFWSAGMMKLRGNNWFVHRHENFPFPFDTVSANFSWFLATWVEILGGLALMLGIFTRAFSFSFLILTAVAIWTVHWHPDWTQFFPGAGLGALWEGYAISNDGAGNFRLPLIFMVMLVPLLLAGPGRVSIDNLLTKLLGRESVPEPRNDLFSIALVALGLGIPLLFLVPVLGVVLVIIGVIAAFVGWRWQKQG